MSLNYIHLSQIEKYVLAFAELFKNIIIARYNSDNTKIESYVKVPIVFFYNDKYFDLTEDSTRNNYILNKNDPDIGFPLPRIALKIDSIDYDKNRKFNDTNYCAFLNQYAPTPLKLNLNVFILTKRATDTLIILEQLYPIFKPDINLNVNLSDKITNIPFKTVWDNTDLGIPDTQEWGVVTKIETILNFSSYIYLFKMPTTLPTNLTIEWDIKGKNEDNDILESILEC